MIGCLSLLDRVDVGGVLTYLGENFMHVDENNLYGYAGEKNLQRTFVFPKNKSVRY